MDETIRCPAGHEAYELMRTGRWTGICGCGSRVPLRPQTQGVLRDRAGEPAPVATPPDPVPEEASKGLAASGTPPTPEPPARAHRSESWPDPGPAALIPPDDEPAAPGPREHEPDLLDWMGATE